MCGTSHEDVVVNIVEKAVEYRKEYFPAQKHSNDLRIAVDSCHELVRRRRDVLKRSFKVLAGFESLARSISLFWATISWTTSW